METFAGPLVVCWLIVVAAIDQRTMRLPNTWLLPAAVAVAAAATAQPAVLGAALVATLPYLGAYSVGHCGAGDVKLAFVVGGLAGGPAAATMAVVAAQLIVVSMAWRRGIGGPRAHGPPLCVATLMVLVAG